MLSGMSYRPMDTATPMDVSLHGDASSIGGGHAGGRVWFPARQGSKNIVRIQFLFGLPFLKTNGSGMRVALQNPTATSNLFLGDGIDDQFVDIANSDPGMAGGKWYRTAPLSASRTVAFGEELVVVWKFDAAGRQGLDTLPVRTRGSAASQVSNLDEPHPNVILEFDDGTFGTMFQGFPESNSQPSTYRSSNPSFQWYRLGAIGDEVALEFSIGRTRAIDGCTVYVSNGQGSPTTFNSCDVILYDWNSNILRSTSLNGHWLFGSGGTVMRCVLFSSKVDLLANRIYRLAVKATITTAIVDVIVRAYAVDNPKHFSCHIGGESWQGAFRLGGSDCWTTLRAERPHIYPHFVDW